MIRKIRIPLWFDVLIEIHKSKDGHRYCEKIKKRVKGSRSQINEIVKKLEQDELITINPTRKIKKLSLTEKGLKIALALITVKSQLL
jgi:Mn-dependent DtxR family transcriptional regulator